MFSDVPGHPTERLRPARRPPRRILVTDGAVVRRLLAESDALVFNLETCGYASDLTSIEQVLAELGPQACHTLLRVDLSDAEATADAARQADPDLVMHLAAESHVDRSIEGPGAFIESNVSGTFHLLQAVREHWEQLPDEVFGSLGETGRFSETTPYDPRSPYSASKAGGAHQLLQQRRPLAVRREADPCGDPQGGSRAGKELGFKVKLVLGLHSWRPASPLRLELR